ncbi:MAG: hypothetical protein KJO18_07965 [Acidimicrobiia bacterium]|nr:hypothetical protein [Acidimicrobiia bacterium]
MQCSTCGANSVIEIELTLANDTTVNFCSCHKCETQWWNRDGESLELNAVLDLARKPNS